MRVPLLGTIPSSGHIRRCPEKFPKSASLADLLGPAAYPASAGQGADRRGGGLEEFADALEFHGYRLERFRRPD